MVYDFSKIEKKWQKKWDTEKVFEANPDKRDKFFATFPYPYINGFSHIGHLYTISRVDAFARYKRLKGLNVLFPQGWHITGSPIVSAAKRIEEKEEKQWKIMEDMGISKKEIPKFKDPKHWVDFFAPEYKKDYIRMGLSIDWRRNFVTTSLNPYYDKFIRWQFEKLKEQGLIEKGKHPVVWDPKTNMPVGDHDRIKGEGETPQDFIWIKFRMQDSDLILIAGTTRPDALYGQSNVWIDPKGEYVVAQVGNEKWVIGKEVFYKIENQYVKAKILRDISPKELIGKWSQGPIVDRKVYSLPANFIDSSVGSGIVYSALEDPVDLYELEKIQSSPEIIKKFNLDKKEVMKLKPIDIIRVPGMGDNLGKHIGEEYGVKSAADTDKLEKAKSELNKRVFRKGIMRENCGACAGMTVPKAQEFLKLKLVKDKDAVMFYELTGEVVSRSLSKCVVKIVSDQWFIRYGDKDWKKKTQKAIDNMTLYPEDVREQFNYVIGWLNDWACTREYGLGTKLPFDEKWVIESLSDSTIYMAYYTIAHKISKFKINDINNEFFDYVFLGKGKGKKEWQELKKEFEYWYPVDFRNSGKDLVQNHLSFFVFNHVAIFPEKYWPVSIGVNGWVRVDGQKMSKSLGNVILLRDMADKFGSDSSRLTILNGGEKLDDPNWDTSFATGLKSKFENLYQIITENYGKGTKEKNDFDKSVESALNRNIMEASDFMEKTLFRSALQRIFFNIGNQIKDYSRTNFNKDSFEQLCKSFIIMISPFAPHFAEELWEQTKGKGFVSVASWPAYDKSKINEKFEEAGKNVAKLIEDINHVVKIVKEREGKEAKKCFVYVLPNEKKVYIDSVPELSKKTGLAVEVYAVNDSNKYDPEGKSKKVKPGKPGIYLE